MIAYAAATDVAKTFLIKLNSAILFPLITLMMSIALIVFLYGSLIFILNAGNDSERAKGKQHIMWGIIGMLVMVSAYSILYIAANTFGVADKL